jgi:hypothetical protein
VIPPRAVVDMGQTALRLSRGVTAELTGRAWSAHSASLRSVSERWQFGSDPTFEVSTDTGHAAHWNTLNMKDPQEVLPPKPLRDICLDLFQMGDLKAMLRRQGVRKDRRYLTIMDGEPVIALGADGAGQKVSEVWFHKESKRIKRIILPRHLGGLDIRFDRWHMPSTRGLFPYEITVLRNGRPVRLLKTHFVVAKAAR